MAESLDSSLQEMSLDGKYLLLLFVFGLLKKLFLVIFHSILSQGLTYLNRY